MDSEPTALGEMNQVTCAEHPASDEAELAKAAAGANATQLSIALRLVLSMERVEYQ